LILFGVSHLWTKELRIHEADSHFLGYEEEARDDYYSDYDRPPSPPTASGGAYYPPGATAAAAGDAPVFSQPGFAQPSGPGFTHHPNISAANMSEYPVYNPQAYTGFPPPPPGPPPPQATGGATGFPPPGPPPMGAPPPPGMDPNHVSDNVSRSPDDVVGASI
jgi:hypothetical protein